MSLLERVIAGVTFVLVPRNEIGRSVILTQRKIKWQQVK
jgi:hypothetical protein